MTARRVPGVRHFIASTEEHFWQQVEKTDSCWNWIGFMERDGYGKFKMNYRSRPAHVWSWFFMTGVIPELPLCLDHLCRNRRCVNPSHLEVVTMRVNILRGESSAAVNNRKTRCNRGHLLDGYNLIIRRRGKNTHRECRECARIQERRRYHEARAA